MVFNEPVLLCGRDVGGALKRRERMSTDRPANGIVVDGVIAVESEVEGPLEAAICGRVCLKTTIS